MSRFDDKTKRPEKEVEALFYALRQVSSQGIVSSRAYGSNAISRTLIQSLKELGIEFVENISTHIHKPSGIQIRTSRSILGTSNSRVNLFAKTADWDLSNLKSSRELILEHGYHKPDSPYSRQLFCTVRAKHPNNQGLVLHVNWKDRILEEQFQKIGETRPLLSWNFDTLEKKLFEKNPPTFWVGAKPAGNGFSYTHAVYTEGLYPDILPRLIDQSTVTMDHLISLKDNICNEKGPLFKITSKGFKLLFKEIRYFDLQSIGKVTF